MISATINLPEKVSNLFSDVELKPEAFQCALSLDRLKLTNGVNIKNENNSSPVY